MTKAGREGQSRYKSKRLSIITFGEFENLLKKIKINSIKTAVVILYYFGLRIAEVCGDGSRKWKVLTKLGRSLSKDGSIREDWIKTPTDLGLWEWKHRGALPGILKEDITIDGDILQIFSQPLKQGKREGAGLLEIYIDTPHVDIIIEQWKRTPPKSKVCDISTWKVWNIISKISDGRIYPHAFRLSRVNRIARNPNMSIADMKQWFGWARGTTADKYIMAVRSTAKIRDSIRDENRRN